MLSTNIPSLRSYLHCLAAFTLVTFASLAPADDFPNPYDTEPADARPMPPEQALASIKLPDGFRATLFAAEPDVRQPIAMTFDERGRLWVCECYTYAEAAHNFDTNLRDRIVIFEDSDGDGRHDRRTVFWDKGEKLTSVELGLGGVFALCPPNLLFIPDKNRDDIPDGPPQVVLDGFQDDTLRHNIANGLKWGPDGWLYGRHGILETSLIGKPGSKEADRARINCGVWRYHPIRGDVEVVLHGTTNPWGFDYDQHGEMFIINTVIGHLWHVVPGSRTERMFGADFNPHTYKLMGQVADHVHWDTGEVWHAIRRGVTDKTSAAGGGHAHSGLMIYQGDNWPEEYRGKVLAINFHGRRLNRDRLERENAGFVARHEPDMVFWGDPWFRGIDLASCPDGGVFVLDWSDTGECHEHDGIHRSSGRIYKITCGKPTPHEPFDLAKMSNSSLVDLQMHENDWWSRQSRRVLRDRTSAGVDLVDAKKSLRAMLDRDPDPLHKLRALWDLEAVAGVSDELLIELSTNPDEYLRVWAVRLLADRCSPKSSPISLQRDAFLHAAKTDPSGLVQIYLASALQRLPFPDRWPLAEALCGRSDFASDRTLPLLLWYGLEPVIPESPDRAIQSIGACKFPIVCQFIARRLIEDSQFPAKANAGSGSAASATPKVLTGLLAVAKRGDVETRHAILLGISEGLRGRKDFPRVPGWSDSASSLMENASPETRQLIRELGVLFRDPETMASLRASVDDVSAEPDVRRRALRTILTAPPDGFAPYLQGLLSDRTLSLEALRGLALYSDPATPAKVLEQFAHFSDAERSAAVDLLSSRPAYAGVLLSALRDKKLQPTDLSAFHARQIRQFNDPALSGLIKELWGDVRDSNADKRAAIDEWKARLSPDRIADADLSRGRTLFQKHCANCHVLFGEGKKIGPDLTGANRQNLTYLLENILDPSAVVGAGFRASVYLLNDGRSITGVVTEENDRTLTIQTEKEALVIDRKEIDETRPTSNSLMPDGLFQTLAPDEVRDLVGYLMK